MKREKINERIWNAILKNQVIRVDTRNWFKIIDCSKEKVRHHFGRKMFYLETFRDDVLVFWSKTFLRDVRGIEVVSEETNAEDDTSWFDRLKLKVYRFFKPP